MPPSRRMTPPFAVMLTLCMAGALPIAPVQARQAVPREQLLASSPLNLIIGGAVRRVLGSQAFVIEDSRSDAGELLVLAPDVEATPVPGTSVIVRGTSRRFDDTELNAMPAWRGIDEAARVRFSRQPILVATALTTASGRSLMASTPPALTSSAVRPLAQTSPVVPARRLSEIQLHPAGLSQLITEVGGMPVRLARVRVLALVSPRVLLVESASMLQATVGNLDRVLVIAERALRVDNAAIAGSDVQIAGVARTLLGVRLSGEVAWPAELTPEMVKRLEVRAAVQASSIRTSDGVELMMQSENLKLEK